MLSIFRKKNSLSNQSQQSPAKGSPVESTTMTMTNRSPVPTPNSLGVRSMNTLSIAPTNQTSESQEFGGIGIVLQPSRSNPQNMEIMHLFNGGPAQTSGLVAVGDVSVYIFVDSLEVPFSYNGARSSNQSMAIRYSVLHFHSHGLNFP